LLRPPSRLHIRRAAGHAPQFKGEALSFKDRRHLGTT
jgi:hypothetical protein